MTTTGDFRQMCQSMADINEKLKVKRAELKKLNISYKLVSGNVHDEMKRKEVTNVSIGDKDVAIYKRVRESPMNKDFIEHGLVAYFADNPTILSSAVTVSVIGNEIASYLVQRKKDKVDGKDVESITMRKGRVAPAKGKTKNKAGTKRKSKRGEPEQMIFDYPPAPPQMQRQATLSTASRVLL